MSAFGILKYQTHEQKTTCLLIADSKKAHE